MNKNKYMKIAGIAFMVALITVDSPVWWLAVIATVVMGVTVFKGRLWEGSNYEN